MADFHVVRRRRKNRCSKGSGDSRLTDRIITVKNDLRLTDFYKTAIDIVYGCLKTGHGDNICYFPKCESISNDVGTNAKRNSEDTNDMAERCNSEDFGQKSVAEGIAKSDGKSQLKVKSEHGLAVHIVKAHEAAQEIVLQSCNKEMLQEIICYGLGNFSDSHIARYQLAFLLLLVEDLNVSILKCWIYDPKFTDEEKQILKTLGFNIIQDNETAKRKFSCKTLFYMPHCGKALYNNLLWANWGTALNNAVILGNSFSRMVEYTPKRILDKTAHYVLNIHPYVTELELPATDMFEDIFNDTAIHTFLDLENKVPEKLWSDCMEPQYESDDPEIIIS